MILETNNNFDIIFIQELLQLSFHAIPSSSSKEGDKVVGAPNYPNQVIFSRASTDKRDYSKVILYINICFLNLHFYFQKNIFNYRDICCFYFFNKRDIFFLLNVYLDTNQSVLRYLKDTEANIQNVLVMTSDFNIRDSDQDHLYLFHSAHSALLIDIANAFELLFLHPTNSISTRYLDNNNNSNSVINLMFLRLNLLEFDSYTILPELQFPSDHALLVVDIHITEEFV